MTNTGFSTYHALEVEVRRRFAAGLTFQANYTFGKMLADDDGRSTTLDDAEHSSSIRNTRYTTSEFMPRHLYNANWIYELPFGPGRGFAPASGFLGKVIGGWQASGLIRGRSGRPLSIVSEVGTFHRAARSGQNTVNLSQPMSKGDLRNLTGAQTMATPNDSSVTALYWFDLCLTSEVSGCPDGGLVGPPNPGELGQFPQSVISGPRVMQFALKVNF